MQTDTSRIDPTARPNDGENEERIIIHGGKPLHGSVVVGGAKNAVLKMMAAALLTGDVSVLRNVPHLTDVYMMSKIIENCGAKVKFSNNELEIDARNLTDFEAPYELVSQLRASFVVLGPLLARLGQARVSLPGGCAIGARPVNIHVAGLQAMGAKIDIEGGYIRARAGRLNGGERVLIGAFGAGFTWGGALVEWGRDGA